jgi:hypothetical protein
MRVRIDSEYVFGALGLVGVGAQMIWPDQKWFGWAFIVLAIMTLLLGARVDGLHVRVGGPQWRSRVNWYLLIAFSAALVFVGALVGYFVDQARGPILWEYNSGRPPLGVGRRSGGPLWIDAFQFTGHNRSDDPIDIVDAYVRSDTTTRTIPLTWALGGSPLPMSEGAAVSGGKFTLVGVLPSTDPAYTQGIIVDQFRKEFESFTFFATYAGQQFKRRFSKSEVEQFLEKADRETREAVNRLPAGMSSGVVRKPKG